MERAWKGLTAINQILRDDSISAGERVQKLYDFVFENRQFEHRRFEFGALADWDVVDLQRIFDLVEEVVAQYTARFYDPRVMDVTYYKRERRVRRHLDQQCSNLFKELILRSGRLRPIELVSEEPIYFLTQQARERGFPKSRNGRASLSVLRERLHLALSKLIDVGPEFRRVALPYEIR